MLWPHAPLQKFRHAVVIMSLHGIFKVSFWWSSSSCLKPSPTPFKRSPDARATTSTAYGSTVARKHIIAATCFSELLARQLLPIRVARVTITDLSRRTLSSVHGRCERAALCRFRKTLTGNILIKTKTFSVDQHCGHFLATEPLGLSWPNPSVWKSVVC